MKAAIAMTSQVMEQVCQLPGVATLDWCDRAAATLCRAHHPSCGMVAVLSVDQRCVATHVEAVGIAEAAGERPAAGGADRQAARDTVREGDWIGWSFAVPGPGASVSDLVRLTPDGARRPGSPLAARWEPRRAGEVLVGAVGLMSPTAGRVLVAELALPGAGTAEVGRVQAVFGAALPLLAVRYVNAIGPAPADRHSWLTPREETILWKLVAGKKVPQIAAELHRSVYTIHDHVKSLHRKLGASNRGQLVARALGHLGPMVARAAEAVGDPEQPGGPMSDSGRSGF